MVTGNRGLVEFQFASKEGKKKTGVSKLDAVVSTGI